MNLLARNPELLPPRDEPYRLQGVYELVADGCRQELILDWADSSLQFRAEEDTDTLTASFHETRLDTAAPLRSLKSESPWIQYIGKECGWTWLAVNQQGYCDSAMISFDGIVPNILLHVIGSSIKVMKIEA